MTLAPGDWHREGSWKSRLLCTRRKKRGVVDISTPGSTKNTSPDSLLLLLRLSCQADQSCVIKKHHLTPGWGRARRGKEYHYKMAKKTSPPHATLPHAAQEISIFMVTQQFASNATATGTARTNSLPLAPWLGGARKEITSFGTPGHQTGN